MIEHDGELDIATAFEQRFGTLALPIDRISELSEREEFPVLINDFDSVAALGFFDRKLASALAGGSYEVNIDSGRGEIFEALVKTFGDTASDAFVAIHGQKTGPSITGHCTKTIYTTGFRVTNPDGGAYVYFAQQRELLHYSEGRFVPSGVGFRPRDSFLSILDSVDKSHKKLQQ